MAGTQRTDPLKIVYMGTPAFAARILDRLLQWPGGTVAAAYCQPDRPCGRGQKCLPPPVKVRALEAGIPVFQPSHFKDPAEIASLAAQAPDVLAVAAYGLILPKAVLDIPRRMPVNVHASLLPRYRGAAPIQRALLNGDYVGGITIVRMVEALDAGPILLQRALRIADCEHAGEIEEQLAEMGGEMLVEALERLASGRLSQIPQDERLATYAPKLSKDEGRIDWTRPAADIHNRIRAMHPKPGAFFVWSRPRGRPLRLSLAPGTIGRELKDGELPGAILGEEDGALAIAAADRVYLCPQVTPEGRKPIGANAFVCGYLARCAE